MHLSLHILEIAITVLQHLMSCFLQVYQQILNIFPLRHWDDRFWQ